MWCKQGARSIHNHGFTGKGALSAQAEVMSVMYGYDIAPVNDPFVALVGVTQDAFQRASRRVGSSIMYRCCDTHTSLRGSRVRGSCARLTVKSLNSFERDRSGTGWTKWWVSLVHRNGLLRELTSLFWPGRGHCAAFCCIESLDNCKSGKNLQMLREVAGTGYGGV